MQSCTSKMDLSALMEKVPPLIDACIQDDVPTFRRLRLVDKEGRRIALLGLTSYTLMKGLAGDTNVCGAGLLSNTHLLKMEVKLALSSE